MLRTAAGEKDRYLYFVIGFSNTHSGGKGRGMERGHILYCRLNCNDGPASSMASLI